MPKEISERIQSDEKVRVVALPNLRAMCEEISGVAHRFWIRSINSNRVVVGYSNPDEYGYELPMYAVFPAYIDTSCHERTLYVVMIYVSILHDNWNGEGWQAFEPLRNCPKLWRSNPDTDVWASREDE